MARIVVRAMTPRELRRHQGVLGFPTRGYIMKRGRRILAMGGLAWRFAWGCDLWLDVRRPAETSGGQVVSLARYMLRLARQLGEEAVYCLRDDHPNSARLLRVVGMGLVAAVPVTFSNGQTAVKELYRWQA